MSARDDLLALMRQVEQKGATKMTAEKLLHVLTEICMVSETCETCSFNTVNNGICTFADVDWEEVLRIAHEYAGE